MMTQENNERLGVVVSGSLNKGVEVKLDSSTSVEDMAVGRYVTIEGDKRRFFGMITDVSLGVTDQRITLTPPDVSDPFMAEVLAGTATYGTLHVLPMLTIGGDAASLIEGPQPVKTVPGHFSVWIWRPRFVLTCRNWSSGQTAYLVRVAPGRPFLPGYCLLVCCRRGQR